MFSFAVWGKFFAGLGMEPKALVNPLFQTAFGVAYPLGRA
jgi:hypothetical protein